MNTYGWPQCYTLKGISYYPNMVLREENQWGNYFLAVGIPEEASKQYATNFHENRMTIS